MLRHYDDIGLLKPAEIDRFTGYRYYREDQLFTIGRITSLKDMGFSLADIVKMLDIYNEPAEMDAFLAEKQTELNEIAKQTEYRLTLLETARKRLRKEHNMNFDVTVKTIPERYAATVQMIVPTYMDEGMLWNTMMGETVAAGEPLVPADGCLAAAQFLDPEYKEENVEIVVSSTMLSAILPVNVPLPLSLTTLLITRVVSPLFAPEAILPETVTAVLSIPKTELFAITVILPVIFL